MTLAVLRPRGARQTTWITKALEGAEIPYTRSGNDVVVDAGIAKVLHAQAPWPLVVERHQPLRLIEGGGVPQPTRRAVAGAGGPSTPGPVLHLVVDQSRKK